MFKKILLAIAAFIVTMGVAFAEVDVNKADQAALDGVKGIGPKISKAIIDERTKNGNFKDWADLEKRVKGIGEKNAAKMSQAGLTVNGQAKSGAPAAAAKEDKKAAKASAPAAAPAAAPASAAASAPKAVKASAPASAAASASASAKK